MGYTQKSNKNSIKYVKDHQKVIMIRYMNTVFENEIMPFVEKSGMKLATFIKQAIKEKIERDNPGVTISSPTERNSKQGSH